MDFNNSNFKKVLLIVITAVVLFCALQNLGVVLDCAKKLVSIISPFILGGCIAFILNVPMRFIENLLFGDRIEKIKVSEKSASKTKKADAKPEAKINAVKKGSIKNRIKRPVSLVISIILVLAIITLVLFVVIPEIAKTIVVIKNSIPGFVQRVTVWFKSLNIDASAIEGYVSSFSIDWSKLTNTVIDFFKNGAGNVISSTVSVATSVFSGLLNVFLGLVFAIYILLSKEKLANQLKRLIYAYLPEQRADKIVSVGRCANKVFSNFITGQFAEAIILGLMFFVTMTIFGFKYALMVSVLIAFTALIPVFGAFIGFFVGTFLILIDNPIRAFWFMVLFLVLQQIEGNLIYPRVVGTSVGLPAMWVLAAVTIGGSLMGVVGMLVFVPLTAVIYALVKESTNNRISEKNIDICKYK